ncbi:MAG: hypothetical protein D6818_01320 [Bacteroidetes bacterium]|nr:MAG: hypothetical protein D6818_01320 [Bacteroidota bacterium]
MALSMLLGSCSLLDPPEAVPAWIRIEPFVLEPNPNVIEGSLSAKIEHAYVSVGGELLGIVNVPATVPVLLEGVQTVTIDPVVEANGSIYYLRIYPFYQRYTTEVTLVPGETVVVEPHTRYRDDAHFALIEDFENGQTVFTVDRDQDNETGIVVSGTDVFEGNASGFIHLTADHPTIEVATAPEFDLLDGGKIFLELNYRTPDVDVLFGLIGKEGNQLFATYNYGIRAKDTWNKIYFDLTDDVLSSQFDEGYKLAIFATLEGSEKEEARIWLDNIKLIHF